MSEPTAKQQADRQDFDRMERAAKGLEAGAPLPEAGQIEYRTVGVSKAHPEKGLKVLFRRTTDREAALRGPHQYVSSNYTEVRVQSRPVPVEADWTDLDTAQPLPEGEKCDRCEGHGSPKTFEDSTTIHREGTCSACLGTGKKPLPEAPRCGGGDPPRKFEAGQRFKGHALGQPVAVTLKEAALIDPGDDEAPFWVWQIETHLGGGGSISEDVLASEYQPEAESVDGEEFLDGYKRSPLAEQICDRLKAREAEAKDKLDRRKNQLGSRVDDDATALIAYTEKRIYRDAILIAADTDLERYVYRASPDAQDSDRGLAKLKQLVDQQAEDRGLWKATDVDQVNALQAALNRLHEAVELELELAPEQSHTEEGSDRG